jgi:hypothetical protein
MEGVLRFVASGYCILLNCPRLLYSARTFLALGILAGHCVGVVENGIDVDLGLVVGRGKQSRGDSSQNSHLQNKSTSTCGRNFRLGLQGLDAF